MTACCTAAASLSDTAAPEEAVRWMSCDELDRPDPYIGFAPELYNVDCVGYESVMLGLFQIMYGPENDVCEKYGVSPTEYRR